ncbi:hypothetical protein AHAS_Ahas06G0176800 [Arachis hypogaea]
MESKAVNVVEFSAKELSLLSGQLNIEASFKIASTTVKALPSWLTLTLKAPPLLLIRYVGDTMRIGRDNKGLYLCAGKN